jgi:non-ribosomal peptide synthase protein (TIGR01720 family)
VGVELSAEETRALLAEVPAAYHTEVNDVLLTALAQALARWTGQRRVHVDLEGHGREELAEPLDVSRTVGWFTTVYPVCLDIEHARGPGEALTAVKEQLRRVPRRGLGYGLLRYQHEGARPKLAALPPAEVSFNYLGQVDHVLEASGPFAAAPEDRGPERSPRAHRTHLLEVSGAVMGGQLRLTFAFGRELHRRDTVVAVAGWFLDALRALLVHCRSRDAGAFTPSDFKLVKLDQRTLDRVLAKGQLRSR